MFQDNIIDIKCSTNAQSKNKSSESAILAIHTDKMSISCSEKPNSLKGRIISVHYSGSQIRSQVDVGGKKMTVIEYQSNDCDYKSGDMVYITWEDSGAILLPMEEGFKERSGGYEEV